MICGKCGAQVPTGAKFCIECGNSALGQTEEPKQRPIEPKTQNAPVMQYTPSLKLENAIADDPAPRGEQKASIEPSKLFDRTSPAESAKYSEKTAPAEPAQPYVPLSQPQKTGESFLAKVAVPALVILILALIFSFVLFILIDRQPGDPAQLMLGGDATEAEIRELRSELRLDSPLLVRYARALIGDYGASYMTRQPVGEMVKIRIPATIKLILAGIIVTLLVSIPLGIASAVWRNRLIDALTAALSMIFRSIPFYMIAFVLLQWFAIGLGLLPVIGVDTWKGYILPSIALGLPCMGFATGIIRATALRVMSRGGQGLIFPESGSGAAQPPQDAVLPTISVSGLQLGWLFGGALLIETVFALPGVGHMLMSGLMSRDTPVVLGAVMSLFYFMSIVTLVLVFIVAIVVFALTPKKARARA